MSTATSLLESVQGLLERTFRMGSDLGELGRFVVGDRGYRRFYGSAQQIRLVNGVAWPGARLLIRESSDEVRACIYYPDGLIRQLEEFPPQRGIGEENVEPFAVLVEELDHLLVFAERCRLARPVSLFELELHANVSKHLVLSRFLAGSDSRLSDRRRLWLRWKLFGAGCPLDDEPGVEQRYRDAARWSVKFLDALSRLVPPRRIDVLRRFHRAEARDKIRIIEALATP